MNPASKNSISIIWDFDGTLTPHDSTSELIKSLTETDIKDFWATIKEISGSEKVNSISTSDAPVWMYVLSQIASLKKNDPQIAFDKNFFRGFSDRVKLYTNVLECLEAVKDLSKKPIYKRNDIKIYHFIITAGLQDLVSAVFEYHNKTNLIEKIIGCRYKAIEDKSNNSLLNIPIYCMDKTTKTRALFEINKGCFLPNSEGDVDDLVPENEQWCPFENMIYIGDGDTDIPAFALVKSRKGMTIGVYNPEKPPSDIEKQVKKMKEGKRMDLLTEASFSKNGELYQAIQTKCDQIAKRYNSYNKTFKT